MRSTVSTVVLPTVVLPEALPETSGSVAVLEQEPPRPALGQRMADKVPVLLQSKSMPVWALAIYCFQLASLSNQFLGAFAHISLPLVGGFGVLICLLYVFAGNPGRFFQTPLALPWIAMMVWWSIAAVIGIYPGRSIPYMATYAWRIELLPLVLCGIAVDLPAIRRVLNGIALGLPVIFLMCFQFGRMMDDRFIIPNTNFANGNDMAMHIVLFGCLALALLNGGKLARLGLFALLPLGIFYVLKTGSRANEITLIVLAFLGFLVIPPRQKIVMIALCLFVPIVTVPLLPKQTTARLASFFKPSNSASNENEAEMLSEAVDSTNARLALQQKAIELPSQHLLFGIGAANFADAVEAMTRARTGEKSGWQVAHNSYLEASAENGIPGCIFYAWCVILCVRLNFQAFRKMRHRPDGKVQFVISFALFLASVTYMVGVFFCTILYDFQLAMLIGLTSANYMVMQDQDKAAAAAARAA